MKKYGATKLSACLLNERLLGAALMGAAPDPGVAVPERGKEMELGGLRPTVGDGDLDEDVLASVFGVLGKHVPVLVLVKDTRVLQLKLGVLMTTPAVLLH